MDFRLTTEQTDIKQAATDFAKGEFDPDAALEYDKEQKFPFKNQCLFTVNSLLRYTD